MKYHTAGFIFGLDTLYYLRQSFFFLSIAA